MKKLVNKIAVITGGSNNIGREICRLFASEGATVFFFDIDENGAKKTIDLIEKEGNTVFFLKCDVTKIDEISHSFKCVLNNNQRIDILVNNVGESIGNSILDIDESTFEKNINNNLKSSFFCTKTVLPTMISHNEGSVIFISTINTIFGGFSEIAYSASKAGLDSLAKVLTAEYAKYNIRFNLISPGSIIGESQIWAKRFRENPIVSSKLSNLYPMKRWGQSSDISKAALFLASSDSSWISGINLIVDGGLSATGNLPGGEWWNEI